MTPAAQHPQLGKCSVSHCKIAYHCAEVHATYKPPCATHSAQQQRIQQVIKELERLAAEEERLKKESKSNEHWMGHTYANSAYLKAIALLQAEVPK